MAYSLSILILFTLISLSVADTCSNPLLKSNDNPYGIPGLTNTATAGSSLNYCQSLSGQKVCCNDTAINSLKDLYQTIKDNITAYIKQKDENVTSSRDYFSTMISNLKRLNQLQKDIVSAGSNSNTTGASQSMNLENYDFQIPNAFNSYFNRTDQLDMKTSTNLTTGSTGIDKDISALDNVIGTFNSNFDKYKNYRKNCFEHFLKGYTKFLCMACMADTSSFYNADSGHLLFNTDFCTRSAAACYDYFSMNEFISGFFDPTPYKIAANATGAFADALADIKQTLTDALNNPSLANTQKLADAMKKLQNIYSTTTDQANSSYTIGYVPTGCTNNQSCQYICDNFIEAHGLNVTELMSPGITQEGTSSDVSNSGIVRLLAASSVQVEYSSTGYNVTNVTSGAETQVSFSSDPAGTSSTTYGMKGVVQWGVIILMIMGIFVMV